ncbi:MAG: O-antigen ligase family protein [Rubrobacteraceae bacterium]
MNGMTEPGNAAEGRPKERRPGRLVAVFKAVVLLALVAVTTFGMLNRGLYAPELWLPVAAGILALMFLTLLARGFYQDVPRIGWALVALMGALVGVKGLSLLWTVSEIATIEEVLRSSMYLAAFLMALAALSSGRQVGSMMDAAVLVTTTVAGYGLLQKISPLEYPVSSVDDVSVDSTLDYSNTLAAVLGIGIVLTLARLTQSRNVAIRGLLAALILAFLATMYLTASRGGIASLGIAGGVMVLLSNHRLQMVSNLLLVSLPGAWLVWRMQGLEALRQAGASDQQKLAAGLELRNDLVISLAAAFVLQCGYALFVNRYEITSQARRAIGGIFLAGAVVAVIGGALLVMDHYGGARQAYGALLSDPQGDESARQRLASLSIGFREDYWMVAWEEWKEQPLTGTGAGTFQYTWLRERPVDTGVKQVHNLYLEQGTETGLFAFLAMVGFAGLLLGYTAREAWRASGSRRLLLSGLVAAEVIYLLSSVIEWHWYLPPSTLFFFILSAMAVKMASWEEREPAEEKG